MFDVVSVSVMFYWDNFCYCSEICCSNCVVSTAMQPINKPALSFAVTNIPSFYCKFYDVAGEIATRFAPSLRLLASGVFLIYLAVCPYSKDEARRIVGKSCYSGV